MVKLQFKSTISSIFLAIFCSNMDIICFICIWGHKLSSVNKNNYRKNTQIYTFLGYFRLPLWLFHKLKGDYQIFILNYRKQHREMHIWTETSYQCCEISYILKTFGPN